MHQQPELDWTAGGVPVARAFDDPYFSIHDGLAETRYVFLSGNDLPARFRDGFHIAELGFGTGLNFLASLASFRAAGIAGRLRYTSFEAHPMAPRDAARALKRFDGLATEILLEAEVLPPTLTGEDFDLSLLIGDARQTLPNWAGRADAWFLDGFSPAKNPELWGPELLRQVAAHTAPGGSFATYTAAGHIRRGLDDVGFDVTRTPGFGRKRHMSRGVLR